MFVVVDNDFCERFKVGLGSSLSFVSPIRDLVIIILYAETVCTYLGYWIQNRRRNKKTTGFRGK